jgi:hypothetical protein
MGDPQPNVVARWADHAVELIAARKAEMLAGAVVLSLVLGVAALVDVGLGNGSQLTKSVVDAGGYLACVAVVVGLPALAYAMVADRSISALSASEREKMYDRIKTLLDSKANELDEYGYQLQVFRPNWRQTRLMPFYDPFDIGPKDGWTIDSRAPQAITGSAWVVNKYTYAQGEDLKDASLHLTKDQHEHYKDLIGVAAVPVCDAAGQRIAVLTICTKEPNPRMDQDEFLFLHMSLAKELSLDLSRIVGPLAFGRVTAARALGHDSASIQMTPQMTESLPSTDEAAEDFRRALTLRALPSGDSGSESPLARRHAHNRWRVFRRFAAEAATPEERESYGAKADQLAEQYGFIESDI